MMNNSTIGSSVPSWISECTVPPYLVCDGTAFSSAIYPSLAAIIGPLPDARAISKQEVVMNENQEITADELKFIRSLSDFDLTMFLSEIHDHGWPEARKLLAMIHEATQKRGDLRDESTN
jgi:hypothetical protein